MLAEGGAVEFCIKRKKKVYILTNRTEGRRHISKNKKYT